MQDNLLGSGSYPASFLSVADFVGHHAQDSSRIVNRRLIAQGFTSGKPAGSVLQA